VTLPDGFDGIGFTYTAPDGTYTIGGLPAGNYKVRFEDVLDMIGDQWWNGQPDYASANLLQLPLLGTTATANATLPVAAGGITGRVTDAVSGQPIEGICADAFDASTGDFISNDTSDVNGNYRIGDLPSGSYKIEFTSCSTDTVYSTEWYDDKADFTSATPVTFTQGTLTTGINASLTQ
jgi:hypothetical protein